VRPHSIGPGGLRSLSQPHLARDPGADGPAPPLDPVGPPGRSCSPRPAHPLAERAATRPVRLPRVSDRERLQLSHQPQRETRWPLLPLTPEAHQARRAVVHRALLSHTHKAGVYTQWGLVLEARGLSAALGVAEAQAAFGIASVAALLFDGYSVIRDARSARHDYLMGTILLHQALALRHALRQREADTGRPAPAHDLEQLAFTLHALETLLANFEAAYYPPRQLPYMAQIRSRIDQSAQELAQGLLAFDALSAHRQALLDAQRHLGDPGERQAGQAAIDALSRDLAEREAVLRQALHDVGRLLSRRSLQREARAQRDRLRALPPPLSDAQSAELAELQRQIEAFERPWSQAVFSPFKGLADREIKRFRDAALQLPKAAVDTSSTALGIASMAAHLIGAAFGGYGLTLLSSLFSLYIARGENKDGKREQRQATAAKQATWTRLGLAVQARQRGALLDDPRGRAMYRAVCGAFIVRQERTLDALHRATRQAQTRRTKGGLSYLVNALTVVGGAVALGTGGAALPFMGLPAALLGGPYLVSVGWRAVERKRDKDRDKALAAVAQTFVRRFGIDAILDFYTDMDSRDPARLRAWRQRLLALHEAWYSADDFTRHLGDEVHHFQGIDPDELGCARLLDNEYLALNLLSEQLHHHARGRRHGQGQACAAAQLLGELGMPADTLQHLLGHHAAFDTPARHREAARQLVAAFWGLRLCPDHRLPAHLKGSPRHIARAVDAQLLAHWRTLDLADDALALLQALQAHPDHGIARLTLAPPAVLAALRRWMQAVREALHQRFVGPVELYALQQALLAARAPGAAGDPGQTVLGRQPLALLDRPIGPLCLELLADPGTLHASAPLRLPEPPAHPPSGPAGLARLLVALKRAGRQWRDHDDHARAPPPQLGDSAQRAAERLDPGQPRLRLSGAAFVRGLHRGARRHTRSVGKRLRQTGPNPLATPAKALACLRRQRITGLAHAPRTDVRVRILRAFLQRSGIGPDTPAPLITDFLDTALRAIEVLAEDTVLGVRAEHARRGADLGARHLSSAHQRLIERLQATAELARRLRHGLDVRAVREGLTEPDAPG